MVTLGQATEKFMMYAGHVRKNMMLRGNEPDTEFDLSTIAYCFERRIDALRCCDILTDLQKVKEVA